MHIVFIDPAPGAQYTVETPYERPMGGSHSSLCYLAAELAGLGHSITIFNANETPSESNGVKTVNISALASPQFLADVDVGIVINSAQAHQLRSEQRLSIPLVLWSGHAHDQPAMQELDRMRERRDWNAFAFVSDWQRQHFEKTFWIPVEKGRVLRNAVSPAFAECANTTPWFLTGEAPVLFYTSTPFRGLDVLLNAFPKIRASVPGTRLRIYSSMSVYQPGETDPYGHLYDLARRTDGVEYIGSVGQSRLAKELKCAAALAYPSTFAETSCIAAIEAMAAGAAIFTTRLGALPETTSGHAAMVDWQSDEAKLAEDFSAMVIEGLQDMRINPQAAAARREQRFEFIRRNYLWQDRAKEWADWLSQIVHKAQPAPVSADISRFGRH